MHRDPSKFVRFFLRFREKDAGEDLRKLGINLMTAAFIGMFISTSPSLGYGLPTTILLGLIIWLIGLFIEKRSD
jgi:hypothetical protein